MNIQIETITLKSGCKMDVIRDIEKVRRLIAVAENLATRLRLWSVNNGDMICEGDYEALKEWDSIYENQEAKIQPAFAHNPSRRKRGED